MKKYAYLLLYAAVAAVIVLAVVVWVVITKTVVESDIPVWLKFLILK